MNANRNISSGRIALSGRRPTPTVHYTSDTIRLLERIKITFINKAIAVHSSSYSSTEDKRLHVKYLYIFTYILVIAWDLPKNNVSYLNVTAHIPYYEQNRTSV